ncbi:MAG: hypothetical protein V4480_00950 [Patescibacteria group bacterium]
MEFPRPEQFKRIERFEEEPGTKAYLLDKRGGEYSLDYDDEIERTYDNGQKVTIWFKNKPSITVDRDQDLRIR